MRGYAELLQRNPDMTRDDVLLAVRRIEDETRRMGVLVDDLLLLARLDQGRPLDRAPVDLTVDGQRRGERRARGRPGALCDRPDRCAGGRDR